MGNGWDVDVHESWEGHPILGISELVKDSTQETNLFGTGTGSHVFQLRGSGLYTGKKPTAAERAYVKSLFALWARKIVVRRDDGSLYDGWISKRWFDPGTGALHVNTVEMRAATLRVRLTYPVFRQLEGSLTLVNRSPAAAVNAILGKTLDWGYGFFIPIDRPADAFGSFSADWPWYQHLTIEDLLAEVEATGNEVYFPPYVNAAGDARYRTVVARDVVGETYPLPLSAAKSAATALADIEDGAGMLTGVEYQGNGSDQDALYSGANWNDLYPGQNPIYPNRDVLRTASAVTSEANLRKIALSDLERDHRALAARDLSLEMNDTVTALWGLPGSVLTSERDADEWNDDGTTGARVISCKTTIGSNSLELKVERYGD